MSTGTPLRRRPNWLYFVVGFAVVFVVLAPIAIACVFLVSSREAQESLAQQPPARQLSALVETRGAELEIFNGDAIDWTNCRLLANGQYSARVDRIAANKIHKMPLLQLITEDGRRFQPLEQAVVKLEIHADQGVWAGELAR